MNEPNTTEVPLRFVLGQGYGDGCICCPKCGGEYTHLGPVNVVQGNTQTFITHDETSVTPNKCNQSRRGSMVQLCFYCEHGHYFSYCFEFHKGITSVSLDARDQYPGEPWNTLWRD